MLSVKIKLDEFSKRLILSELKNFIPKWDIVLDGGFIYQGIAKRKEEIGKKYNLLATHFGYSNGSIALKTKYQGDNQEIKVVIAVNKKSGYTEKDAEKIKEWFEIKRKFTLQGILAQYSNEKIAESEKSFIKEKTQIFRVAFYDFDNTLVEVLDSELAKKIWERKTGRSYPHIGWWSKKESLDTEIFKFKPIKEVVEKLKRDFDDDSCWTVLLTNRLDKLQPEVTSILNSFGVSLDELKMAKSSSSSKVLRIKEVLNELPQSHLIEIYDDDDGNIKLFEQLKVELEKEGKNVTIYHINPSEYIPRVVKVTN
jgi:hypothetical protein